MKEEDSIAYPESVKQEEHYKELYVYLCSELGVNWVKLSKEKHIDVYRPRIDVLSLLPNKLLSLLKDTIMEHFRQVVCFEVHLRTLDFTTLLKWYLELFGLYMIGQESKGYEIAPDKIVGYAYLKHYPVGLVNKYPELFIPQDPIESKKPALIELRGVISWYFIIESHLRDDKFCLLANILNPSKHERILKELDRYGIKEELKYYVVKAVEKYRKKRSLEMIDIAEILKKKDRELYEEIEKRSILYFNAYQEGKDKGFQEGEDKGEKKLLLRAIKKKFGRLPSELESKINRIENIEEIERLLDLTFEISDLDEFIRRVGV